MDEPVSISTVTGGMAGHLYLGVWNGEDVAAGLLGCGQDREGPLRVGRASSYEVTPSKFERVRGAAGESFAGQLSAAADYGARPPPELERQPEPGRRWG